MRFYKLNKASVIFEVNEQTDKNLFPLLLNSESKDKKPLDKVNQLPQFIIEK